jgi:hypothetical protein
MIECKSQWQNQDFKKGDGEMEEFEKYGFNTRPELK